MKYLLSFLLILSVNSCSKNFQNNIDLKRVPATGTQNTVENNSEATQLKNYEEQINSINTDNVLTQLKTNNEKKEFKYRIAQFKTSYNKCVDLLKNDKRDELKECMFQLSSSWQFILANYKI